MLLEEDVSRGNKMFEGNVLPLRIYIRAILNKCDTIRERDYKIYIYTMGKVSVLLVICIWNFESR